MTHIMPVCSNGQPPHPPIIIILKEVGRRKCIYSLKNCNLQPTLGFLTPTLTYTRARANRGYAGFEKRAHACTFCCDTAHSCIACRIKAIRTSHCIFSLSPSHGPAFMQHSRTRQHTLKPTQILALYQITLSNMPSSEFESRFVRISESA